MFLEEILNKLKMPLEIKFVLTKILIIIFFSSSFFYGQNIQISQNKSRKKLFLNKFKFLEYYEFFFRMYIFLFDLKTFLR